MENNDKLHPIMWFCDSKDGWVEKEENIVFCRMEKLNDFFKKYKKPCILVSQSSDFFIQKAKDGFSIRTCNNPNICSFDILPENIIKWYSTGLNFKMWGCHCMPLGIHNLNKEIDKYYDVPKTELLYVNFNPTNEIRRYVEQFLVPNWKWATVQWPTVPLDTYAAQIAKHKFMLCPSGDGIECYRTCEALYSKTIPIVLKSPYFSYFDDMPILIIDEYDILTPDFLEEKYEELSKRDFNDERLSRSYWTKEIRNSARLI